MIQTFQYEEGTFDGGGLFQRGSTPSSLDPEVVREFSDASNSLGTSEIVLYTLLGVVVLSAVIFFVVFTIVKLNQINKATKEIKAKQEELEKRIGKGF